MAKKKTVKKKAVAKVAAPQKPKYNRHLNTSTEHNVFKIVVTTMVVWGIVLLAVVYMLRMIADHNYLLMMHP